MPKRTIASRCTFAWTTPVEGVPGRWQHNVALAGEEVDLPDAEAKRGDALGVFVDQAAARAAEAAATTAAEAELKAEQERVEAERSASARARSAK